MYFEKRWKVAFQNWSSTLRFLKTPNWSFMSRFRTNSKFLKHPQFYAYPMTRKLPCFWNNVNVNLGIFGENLEWLRFLHQSILLLFLLLFRFLHQPIYLPIRLSHRTNFFSKYLTYLTLTSYQFMPFCFPQKLLFNFW